MKNTRKEKWLPIEGTRYWISSIGNVVSNISGQRRLKPIWSGNYYQYTLRINGKSVTIRAHRLVGLYFVKNSNPTKFNTLNHKDSNTKNNHYKNLEWTTQADNNEHCWSSGRRSHKGSKHPIAILTESQVKSIRSKFVPYIYTHNHLAKEFGITPACVRSALHQWKHI